MKLQKYTFENERQYEIVEPTNTHYQLAESHLELLNYIRFNKIYKIDMRDEELIKEFERVSELDRNNVSSHYFATFILYRFLTKINKFTYKFNFEYDFILN